MDNKLDIILKTARQLTTENPRGWVGDNCDLVAASGSVSQALTTGDVRDLQAAYANATLHVEDLTFTFYREGRDNMIMITQTDKN